MSACLTVLDVGHGNAAVISGSDGVVVIDAGPGGGDLLRYLREAEVSELKCVVISHVDADHLRGLIAVLEEPSIRVAQVRLNPDAAKQSELWEDLAWTLANLDQAGDCDFQTACVQGDELPKVSDGVSLSVVSPTKELAAHGPGWTDSSGRTATTNTCSVVVRVVADGEGAAILAADMDAMGLAYIGKTKLDLAAKLLVFPHHGGHVGGRSDPAVNAVFANELLDSVGPETVIFSTGRGRHGTPRPEIVAAVRARNTAIRIACTQLSERCRPDPISLKAPGHLLPLHARGRENDSCCAGSMRWDLSTLIEPDAIAHDAFKASEAPTAMCL